MGISMDLAALIILFCLFSLSMHHFGDDAHRCDRNGLHPSERLKLHSYTITLPSVLENSNPNSGAVVPGEIQDGGERTFVGRTIS